MVFEEVEKVSTLAAMLEVSFTTSDLLMFFSLTLLMCSLHILIEHGLKMTKRPACIEKDNWHRCCKDTWRLTNHS